MTTRKLGWFAIAVVGLAAGGCSKEAKTTGVQQAAPETIRFTEGEYLAVVLSQGSMWDTHKSRDEQEGMKEHRAYMLSLFEHGEIVLGGPFLDRPGGVAVYRTKSRDQAEQLAGSDPGVRSGLIRAEVTRWRLGVGAEKS